MATLSVLTLVVVAGCGDDGDSNAAEAPEVEAGSNGEAGSSGGGSNGGAGGDTTLVVDGESIEMGGAACNLEPEEEWGGDGMILVTAQATGTNAEGVRVFIAFTRYDSESQFHGDDLMLEIGEPAEGDTYTARFDEGTIPVSDGVVSSQDVTMTNRDLTMVDSPELVVSFEMGC